MGAPKAFEFRREELSILQNKKLDTVSDSMVLESFEKEMGPNGSFTEFLSHVQLGHVIGNTLFVHGGITEENLGFIPGEREAAFNTNIHEWVKGLNHWYKNQFNSWQSAPQLKNAGVSLVDYTRKVPDRKDNPKSTVYGKNADENGNPFLPSTKVIEALMASGITRIVVGHNPTGQSPFIMRWKDLFEIVSGDTSYSPNYRRANQITLKGKNLDTLAIESHPIGIKGLPEKVAFSIKLGEHTPIGKMLPDHSVVVAALPNGYWAYKQEDNYVHADSILSHEQVHGLHLIDPFQVQKTQCDSLIRLGRTNRK